jgi:hypothetical protein
MSKIEVLTWVCIFGALAFLVRVSMTDGSWPVRHLLKGTGWLV